MCGRFVQFTTDPEKLYKTLKMQRSAQPAATPRYNLAPTQDAAVLRIHERDQERALEPLRWGLIPWWAKDKKIGARMINARAETLASKSAFKDAFKRRRCLIPSEGFYEWKKLDPGAKKSPKQPYLIRLKDGEPFVFAGLWDTWRGPEGTIESFTIITVAANQLCLSIHKRMPLILPADAHDTWLDPELEELEVLQRLLLPFDSDAMEAYPVATLVNSYKNDVAACLEPAKTGGG